MITQTEEKVLDAVRKHVKDRHPGGAILEVLSRGIRQEQDWWYVLVQPDKEPDKRYEYYEALADAEVELMEQDDLTVLLVPVLPNEELTAA